MKKIISFAVSVILLLTAVMPFAVTAEEAKTEVDGIKWFPCEPGREDDPVWEVEYDRNYDLLFQSFNDGFAGTGMPGFLDTEYSSDGSLTITRNGNDGDEFYWPRIRTVMLDDYPEMDWSVANTLHFDIYASPGTAWNLYLSVNGVIIKLGREIAKATGNSTVTYGGGENSDNDAGSGRFIGSINIQDALETIANTSGDPNAPSAMAIGYMKTTYIPQLQIFCVGDVGASVTIRKLHMSTASDTSGAQCDYLDMGLIFGDEYYDSVNWDSFSYDTDYVVTAAHIPITQRTTTKTTTTRRTTTTIRKITTTTATTATTTATTVTTTQVTATEAPVLPTTRITTVAQGDESHVTTDDDAAITDILEQIDKDGPLGFASVTAATMIVILAVSGVICGFIKLITKKDTVDEVLEEHEQVKQPDDRQ